MESELERAVRMAVSILQQQTYLLVVPFQS